MRLSGIPVAGAVQFVEQLSRLFAQLVGVMLEHVRLLGDRVGSFDQRLDAFPELVGYFALSAVAVVFHVPDCSRRQIGGEFFSYRVAKKTPKRVGSFLPCSVA